MKYIKLVVAGPDLEELKLTPEINRLSMGVLLREYFTKEKALIDSRRENLPKDLGSIWPLFMTSFSYRGYC